MSRIGDWWFGRPVEQRSLPQITDIGLAFEDRIATLTGQQDSAIPTVYRCIQMLSDLVASLSLTRISDGVVVPHPLFNKPNPSEPYHNFMHKVMSSLLYRGNAYLWVESRASNGDITSLYVLNPDEVVVTPDAKNLYPKYQWRGTDRTLGRDIFHIPINLPPGQFVGLGPIEAARSLYEGVRAEGALHDNLMKDEATPSGILNVPGKLTQPEAQHHLDMWTNTGKRKQPRVMSGGVTFQPLTINPLDAQFIDQRNFSVLEIARMFGLDAFFLLAAVEGNSLTYTNITDLFRNLVTITLNPTYLERIGGVFSEMVPNGDIARFDTSELLRADIKARYDAYQVGIEAGFLLVKEVRELEGLFPFDVNPN